MAWITNTTTINKNSNMWQIIVGFILSWFLKIFLPDYPCSYKSVWSLIARSVTFSGSCAGLILNNVVKICKYAHRPSHFQFLLLSIAFNDFTNWFQWFYQCLGFLTGHRGSAVAKVFKLFKAENGEHFNVSSTSEWVQGKRSVGYFTRW